MLLKKKVAWPRSHEFDEMKIWNSYPTRVLKQSNFELRGCLSQPQLLHVEEPNDDGDAVNDVS